MTRMITIYKVMELSSAHQLALPYESKCNRLHGHNFRVEVWITGQLDHNGMVVDFYHVKKEIMKLDHQNLNDFMEIPTAENIAFYIINVLKSLSDTIHSIKVRVWETSSAYAEVEEISDENK